MQLEKIFQYWQFVLCHPILSSSSVSSDKTKRLSEVGCLQGFDIFGTHSNPKCTFNNQEFFFPNEVTNDVNVLCDFFNWLENVPLPLFQLAWFHCAVLCTEDATSWSLLLCYPSKLAEQPDYTLWFDVLNSLSYLCWSQSFSDAFAFCPEHIMNRYLSCCHHFECELE